MHGAEPNSTPEILVSAIVSASDGNIVPAGGMTSVIASRIKPADSVQKLLDAAKTELHDYNVLNLGQLMPGLKDPVEAEFYVVFGPDSTRAAQVLDVKFIKGAESLKPLATQLKSIKFQLMFPDSSPTKVVRRGALLCLPKPGGCSFTMIGPDLITSVE